MPASAWARGCRHEATWCPVGLKKAPSRIWDWVVIREIQPLSDGTLRHYTAFESIGRAMRSRQGQCHGQRTLGVAPARAALPLAVLVRQSGRPRHDGALFR